MLESYLVSHSGCDMEWKSWMVCGAKETYDTQQECSTIDSGQFVGSVVLPCQEEKLALGACSQVKGPWKSVSGSYTTCNYGPTGTGPCSVICTVDESHFDITCAANPALPLLCSCSVNGHYINQDFGGMGQNLNNFYATDCADAAKSAADGKCTNRLECCFQYTDGGKEVCLCGSDPKLLGQPSCQALADFTGGKVVDICPQFLPEIGDCWPPPCQ
ncbi:MAG: hypothetical protein IPM35_08190 [Myxococcales bacterium]|nr:hypothetical protein [Myxococcales bacterium]